LFGGQGFTINGNMAASAYHDGRLMIRCAKADHETLLAEPGASPKLSGTKPMAGWVLVESSVVVNDNVLLESVVRGRDYAASLPPKDKKASPSRQ
jgi:TfoX/Sxy family transcriptional regulator of competence genes